MGTGPFPKKSSWKVIKTFLSKEISLKNKYSKR
jgi:hypothetical protein